MKKEVSPAVMIAIIVVALILIVGGGLVATGTIGGGGQKVNPADLSPEELRDDDPPRPGQPGYQQRTTDPAPQ